MSIDLSINAILKYLNENGFQPELQKETNQVFIIMEIQKQEIPVFFVIRQENELLQTIAYLPFQLQDKTSGEVARILHILNKECDMPGFGLDESEKLMFFRCVIPCFDKKIDTRLLKTYLATTRLAVDTFMQAIGVVVSGMSTVDKLLKLKPPHPNNAS